MQDRRFILRYQHGLFQRLPAFRLASQRDKDIPEKTVSVAVNHPGAPPTARFNDIAPTVGIFTGRQIGDGSFGPHRPAQFFFERGAMGGTSAAARARARVQ